MRIIVLLIILGSAAALVAAGYIGVLLGKKGISLAKVETAAEKLAAWAVSAADALAPFLPEPYKSLIGNITKSASSVVQTTEALNDASMLATDQRKAAATNIIVKDLQEAKITVDSNVQKLISVSIDAACLLLPHHMEAAAANTAQAPAPATATPVQ